MKTRSATGASHSLLVWFSSFDHFGFGGLFHFARGYSPVVAVFLPRKRTLSHGLAMRIRNS